MNYFFQDELSYPINMLSWSDDFPQEFQRRKGYDVIPYLSALKEYIGAVTPKIRLDYADVLISLAEERYFEPIYEVKKNDSLVGILLSLPYQLDITPYMKEGNNKMEILVYSTLANHYQTIPTPPIEEILKQDCWNR